MTTKEKVDETQNNKCNKKGHRAFLAKKRKNMNETLRGHDTTKKRLKS